MESKGDFLILKTQTLLKNILNLILKGTSGFAAHVDKCLEISAYFEDEIRKRPECFKPVLEHGWYANICFWYIPKRLRKRPIDTIWNAEIHKVRIYNLYVIGYNHMVCLYILVKQAIQVAPILKERMMAAGTLMITFQPHKGKAKPKPN